MKSKAECTPEEQSVTTGSMCRPSAYISLMLVGLNPTRKSINQRKTNVNAKLERQINRKETKSKTNTGPHVDRTREFFSRLDNHLIK
jgi:hypothetical protein